MTYGPDGFVELWQPKKYPGMREWMSNNLKMQMSQKHEVDVSKRLGGRKTKASGSQWNDPLDGRRNRYTAYFAWAWDCKATHAKSMSISRAMLDKLKEQAMGERPILPVRFYDDERLKRYEDWVLVRLDDFEELNELADIGSECADNH